MIDDKALAEMEARMQAATPGPWTLDSDCDIFSETAMYPKDHEMYDVCPNICVLALPYCSPEQKHHKDYEFIAHAREDMEALIAEVRRLRKGLAESFLYAAEAKKKFAPDTTNSRVDEWLKSVDAILRGSGSDNLCDQAVSVAMVPEMIRRGERIEELEDENQSLKFNLDQKSKEIGRSEHRGNTVDYIYDKLENYSQQLMAAGSRVRKLEAALEFYAEPYTWCRVSADAVSGHVPAAGLDKMYGEKARAALGEKA